MKVDMAKAFLLGIIVALLAVIAFKPAVSGSGNSLIAAEGGSSANGMIVVGLSGDTVAIMDAVNKRLAIYSYTSSKLKLKAARNLEYDLKVEKELSSSKGYTYDQIKKLATGKK
ncbi:MAG: hypothetical protein ACYTFY_03390 [Planctomycetota bacterium]